MDQEKFPLSMGTWLGGKSFLLVFETHPKIVEYVRTCWTSSTGLFKTFYDYVIFQLSVPQLVEEHEERCRQFCKKNTKLPGYLLKYKDAKKEQIISSRDEKPC